MESIFLELLRDSPWIAVTVGLLWRHFKREDAILEAYKEGSENAQSLMAAIQSLEHSLGMIQTSISRIDLRCPPKHQQ